MFCDRTGPWRTAWTLDFGSFRGRNGFTGIAWSAAPGMPPVLGVDPMSNDTIS
jgi:hypothetical protein